MRAPSPGAPLLQDRLTALSEAVDAASGRLEDDALAEARAVLARAGERLVLAPDWTVVALAGATGSGKSSLFNALVGRRLADVSVRRPTTDNPRAAIWPAGDDSGSGPEEALLDWLGVARRDRVEGPIQGLILIDMPDHDSVETTHRLEVDRLTGVVDLLVWVVDPQKYADAALHQRYVRPLAGHGGVMLFALNHADRLDRAALDLCRRDLHRLLTLEGLAEPLVLVTSTVTGEGVEQLRSLIGERVAGRRAAAARLGADVTMVAAELSRRCEGGRSHHPGRAEQRSVADALGVAAGADALSEAARAASYRAARLATGWPFTRWLRRVRADPLRTLLAARRRASRAGFVSRSPAPTAEKVTAATPSAPRAVNASASERAAVAIALRDTAAAATRDLPAPWAAAVRRAASQGEERVLIGVEDALADVEVDVHAPRWWRAIGRLQWLLAAVTVSGLLWLGGLFALSFFRAPSLRTPEIRGWPVPTVFAIGGALGGLLLAWLAGRIAAVGARVRGRTVRRLLSQRMQILADEVALAPIRRELDAYERFCGALRTARSGTAPRRATPGPAELARG